jgi:hypothetical protein
VQGAAACWRAVAAAGRAGGRRRPSWAELPGDMGRFQIEVARVTRRNGPKLGMGRNSREKDLSSKIKESNTFKVKFELRPNQHKFK